MSCQEGFLQSMWMRKKSCLVLGERDSQELVTVHNFCCMYACNK